MYNDEIGRIISDMDRKYDPYFCMNFAIMWNMRFTTTLRFILFSRNWPKTLFLAILDPQEFYFLAEAKKVYERIC